MSLYAESNCYGTNEMMLSMDLMWLYIKHFEPTNGCQQNTIVPNYYVMYHITSKLTVTEPVIIKIYSMYTGCQVQSIQSNFDSHLHCSNEWDHTGAKHPYWHIHLCLVSK